MEPRLFFDAHCDTALKVLDDGADFAEGSSSTHLDFPRFREAGVRAQLFACFVLSERYPRREVERVEELFDCVETMVAATDGELRIVRTGSELRAAFEGGPAAAILGLEGADPLQGRAANLRRFRQRGVRSLIFAWKDNPFSGTAFGRNDPLTAEGERLLGLSEELGVMVDVSHLSDAAFENVCRASTRPFIASHSNCRTLCPSGRNLTDRMMRSLADRGGVMGINLSTSFLSPSTLDAWKRIRERFEGSKLDWREREQVAKGLAPTVARPPFEWITRHVLHAINVGGEDAVGLGGDLDGILHLPEGVEGVQDYPKIPEALRAAGVSEGQIEKICHRNFLRVFGEVLSD